MKEHTIETFQGKMILFATILASGMAFLDGSVVTIAIPAIQQKLNATLTGIQWIVNGYALMLCALILISGALGDRFGRKKVFAYGIGVFVISSFFCSISQSVTELAIARIIQGVGGAMMVPGSLSIINLSFKESVRGRAIGLWSGFAGGISAIGPFVGGYLVQYFGWSSIFLINIPLGMLALFLTLKFIPESKNKEMKRVDIRGAFLIFLSLLGISYGFISVTDLGWTNPLIILAFIIGIVSFILFIFEEKHTSEPLVPFTIFKSSLVTGANLVTLFLYFALSGVIFFFVLNLQQVQHYPPTLAGLATLAAILIITFLSEAGGVLADKIGPRVPMILGPLIVSVGMILLAIPGTHANYFLQYFPGLVLFGLGMSLVIAPLTKSALSVDEKYSGGAAGVNDAVARVASLFAVALLGVVMISLFKGQLTASLSQSSLPFSGKQEIMKQENKLAGIAMPAAFTLKQTATTRAAIDDSFIYGFRWAMGINAFLALLSAVVAYFTIHNIKKSIKT